MKFDLDMIKVNPLLPYGPDNLVVKIALLQNIDKEVVDRFEFLLNSLTTAGVDRIMFDFSRLEFIDSAGIGTLIKYTKIFRKRRGNIVLLDVPDALRKIFNSIHLERFINYFTSQDDAIKFFFAD